MRSYPVVDNPEEEVVGEGSADGLADGDPALLQEPQVAVAAQGVQLQHTCKGFEKLDSFAVF